MAIALTEESIRIYRRVAPENPTEYEAELAKMLTALAILNEDIPAGHEREQEAIFEAINILGPLVDQRSAIRTYLSLAQQVQSEILVLQPVRPEIMEVVVQRS